MRVRRSPSVATRRAQQIARCAEHGTCRAYRPASLPVRLNIDYDAAHGVGTAQSSINQQRADLISFLLWQFGVEGCAPQAAAEGAVPAAGR